MKSMVGCWIGVLLIISLMFITPKPENLIAPLAITVLSALICTNLYRKGV